MTEAHVTVNKLISSITIEPQDSHWYEYAHVLDPELRRVDGVYGSKTVDGSWIGGTGATPEAAIFAFKRHLADIILASMVAEPRP